MTVVRSSCGASALTPSPLVHAMSTTVYFRRTHTIYFEFPSHWRFSCPAYSPGGGISNLSGALVMSIALIYSSLSLISETCMSSGLVHSLPLDLQYIYCWAFRHQLATCLSIDVGGKLHFHDFASPCQMFGEGSFWVKASLQAGGTIVALYRWLYTGLCLGAER